MTETISFYTTKEERQTLIEAHKDLAFWVLHDDFNVGPRGENRITFTDVEKTTAPVKSVDTYLDEFIDLFPNNTLNNNQKNTAKDKLKRALGVLPPETL